MFADTGAAVRPGLNCSLTFSTERQAGENQACDYGSPAADGGHELADAQPAGHRRATAGAWQSGDAGLGGHAPPGVPRQVHRKLTAAHHTSLSTGRACETNVNVP